jgi:methylated-DNA-[protein]-cysteine S-methyltransferase
MTNLSKLVIESPVGPLYACANDVGLTHLWLSSDVPIDAPLRTTPILARVADQVAEYFAGTRHVFDLPLEAGGTPFQQRVWRALTTIPFGVTWSYGELARAIGNPTASRAVGAANGRNPIGIIVPCHRVIGANGTLTGYAGGLPMKHKLLAHEQQIAPRPIAGGQLSL